MHIISLGAGVQSSTMALMAAHGEITPMPDCAIFADTQSEPRKVYEWLAWLAPKLPFPVITVTAGCLRNEIMAATRGEQRMDARPPFFVEGGGMLRRQCTQDFKLAAIQKKTRELLGLVKRQRAPKVVSVIQWIGISTDEVGRMKPSRLPYVEHRWPLVENRMSRGHCIEWLQATVGRVAPKSACTFCPYHDDAAWLGMQLNDPESFADACTVDAAIRNGVSKGGKSLSTSRWFVHRTLKPLAEVDFAQRTGQSQQSMFGDECEGMCGV
jgi:hypothetical protein